MNEHQVIFSLGSNGSSRTSSQSLCPIFVISQDLKSMHRNSSANNSNSSPLEGDSSGWRSPSTRPRQRSRSLSSPIRSPAMDNKIIQKNTLYRERFPKAMKQMEERLEHFIASIKMFSATFDFTLDSVAIVRFAHHQILEIASNCLQKTKDMLITSQYFEEMSQNLWKLLNQAQEKSAEAATHLSVLIRRLLLIISRPACLLEYLEFDPEKFCQFLEVAKGHVCGVHGIHTNVPQYLISKLGLDRDPIAELQKDFSSLEPFVSTEDSNSSSADPTMTLKSPKPSSTSISNPQHSSTPKKIASDSEQRSTEDSIIDDEKERPSYSEPSENDFNLIKLISNGAYGAVYLVRHKVSRERFALKKMNKQNLILRNQVDQVFAERDIMSFADNPFVVSMYCSFETKKHLCMVMEYVEGGDCAALLKNIGPYPPDMARFYFAETVLAVEYLHSFGIVHRDLKPDNLLITALGHIKLTDFGLSKMGLMSLATNLYEDYIDKEIKQFSDNQVFGTPEYIAPEVILRLGYGKPVDWWSMGIILYQFLIGCVPFFGETPEELFAHTVNNKIEWPQEDDWPVPPEAKEIITMLLQQNPLDRLGTAGSFEVKEHHYFSGLDWSALLRYKADFIPQLEDDEDISYFDLRTDRYNHEVEEEECQGLASSEEDTDDNGMMFASFASASPRYRKDTGESNHSGDQSGNLSITLSPEINRLEESNISKKSSNHQFCGKLKNVFPQSHGHQLRSSSIPYQAIEIVDQNLGSSLIQGQHSSLQTDHKLRVASTMDSSQTEKENFSPLLHRRWTLPGNSKVTFSPKFSFSMDERSSLKVHGAKVKSKSVESDNQQKEEQTVSDPESLPVASRLSVKVPTGVRPKAKSIEVPSSATELSFIISMGDCVSGGQASSGGSSIVSKRDGSINTLNAPIIMKRGPRGFGFTIQAIRVYFGDTDIYTVHHLVMEVDKGSPAFDAGLRPGHLITHINGESVQGLFHTQVMQLIISGGDVATLRATALEATSIKKGGRQRDPKAIKMVKRASVLKYRNKKRQVQKKQKTLFRKMSSKKAMVKTQQITARSGLLDSQSLHSLVRDYSESDSCSSSPADSSPCSSNALHSLTVKTLSHHSFNHKHKLQRKTKMMHSPGRRKSFGHIPLSPLAQTLSSSPLTDVSPAIL